MAVVDAADGADDLRACAGRVAAWHDAGLATPLLLAAQEFGRSLDAFPLEFGAILADHVGRSPAAIPSRASASKRREVRQACEVQARSHLLHLRERATWRRAGAATRLAELIARSAAPFAALMMSVARLHGAEPRDASAGGGGDGTRDRAAGTGQPRRDHEIVGGRGRLQTDAAPADLSRLSRRGRAPHERTSIAGAPDEGRASGSVVLFVALRLQPGDRAGCEPCRLCRSAAARADATRSTTSPMSSTPRPSNKWTS